MLPLPPLRLIALLWAVALLAGTFSLAFGFGPDLDGAEEGLHLAGHVVLFGTLAYLSARSGARPSVAIAASVGVGVAVEGMQMWGAHRWLVAEATFDTTVDALAAMLGAALAAPDAAARALGNWLHPAFVLPVGLAGVVYAGDRDAAQAIGWALVGTLAFAPAGLVWIVGVRRGWFTTADLVDRRARPPLFALGCLSAAGFVALAHENATARVAAMALLTLAVTITMATTAGFKLSGHVATALTLAAVCAPWSARGPALFLACAALLSWARVRAGVHRPVEVAGAWVYALALVVGMMR